MLRTAIRSGQVTGAGLLLAIGTLAQTTTRASVDSSGVQGDGFSLAQVRTVTPGARYLAFESSSTNLVPGDTNGVYDVFVRDMLGGTTIRVSTSTAGTEGSARSNYPSISDDGNLVAFESDATNLVFGDTNGNTDIFVRDIQSGMTTLVSVDSTGVQGDGRSRFASISADGSCVVFQSDASNLVAGDTNGATDIFVYELQSGATTRISVDSAGAEGNSSSTWPSISADGRYVAFTSNASNLVGLDTNGHNDIFVRDRASGTTVRVNLSSAGVQANLNCDSATISRDGRRVAFVTRSANLIPGDTNGCEDVLVRDLQAGTTTRVSVGANGIQADNVSFEPAMSADGRFVAFASAATNLVTGDTNQNIDVFVHDLEVGTTTRVSVSAAGGQGDDSSIHPAITPDGRFVSFHSYANNLVPGDTNVVSDVFVRDRGVASAFVPFCAGDGVIGICPCTNYGALRHGCENSAGTGGAILTASGAASLSADTVQLTSSGELPSALSIVLQGDGTVLHVAFGDGLRCTGGTLRRLYKRNAVAGVLTAPLGADPSISVRSAALGDLLLLGATRNYQVYYRDAFVPYCPAPFGDNFNVSNAVAIAWGL